MIDPRVQKALALANEIGDLLDRYDQAVQGATLAQLLAKWLFSHPGQHEARLGLLEGHVASVRRMVERLENDEMSKRD